ncbi:MAG: hypothetical protein ACYDHP_05195 [Ferrimicrobium sp.]
MNDDYEVAGSLGTLAGRTRLLGLSLARIAGITALVVVSLAPLALVGGTVGEVVAVAVACAAGWVSFGSMDGGPIWALVVVGLRRRVVTRGPRGVVERDGILMGRAGSTMVVARRIGGLGGVLASREGALRAVSEWTHFLNAVLSQLDQRSTVVLRVAILPMQLASPLASSEDENFQRLYGRAYVREALVAIGENASRVPPRRTRARLMRTSEMLEASATSARSLTVETASQGEGIEMVTGSLGVLSKAFGADRTHMREFATHVEGVGFAASGLVAVGWPALVRDPRVLHSLIRAQYPTRLVGVVLQPVSPTHAARIVRRDRTELYADGLMRTRHGFLARVADEADQGAKLQVEEELVRGFWLCRYQLAVVVVAPTARELIGATRGMLQLGARAQIQLRPAYGRHRDIVERIVGLGITRWS